MPFRHKTPKLQDGSAEAVGPYAVRAREVVQDPLATG